MGKRREVISHIQWLFKHKRVVVAALLFITLFLLFWFCLPKRLFNTSTSFVIDDNQGQLLGASIASDGQWRFPYNPRVPKKFKDCIIAFEDQRFEHHLGFDLWAFGRALKQNIKAGHVVSGASTLTMQVIRLSTRNDRTIWQKILELFKAMRLEIRCSKDEIMALYASNAPFGSNVVGLDAASWRYFGRAPEQLSWGEMASLAVLPNSPSLVHPGKNRETLKKKRNRLLDKLYRNHIISATAAYLAKQEPVPQRPLPLPQLAPHLLDRFKSDHASNWRHGSRITTSIHSILQQHVIDILERHHQVLKANDIRNAAAIVLDVETGQALAYVGNIFHTEQSELESNVDIIGAPRSPGSTLKPMLYAAMMNDGLILPNSLVPDIPTLIDGYRPENFDLGYDGAVPASNALARSLNVPAVRMLQAYKYERFYSLLHRLGISTLKQPADFYGLSLILGGGENNLWELSGVYADMARVLNHYATYKGKYDPKDIHAPCYVKPQERKPELEKNGVLSAAALYFTVQAMEEVMRPGDEMLWQQFSSTQRIAWKTGTSFGFRDGWAIGLSPRYVVGVWVGNADGEGRPGLIGVKTAAPIMFEIFRQLPTKREWFKAPETDMCRIAVCHQSGYRASENCDQVDTIWAPKSGLKAPVCSFHQIVHLDASQKWQVTSACEMPMNMVQKPWFVLPPSMEYYYKTKNYEYKTLPPFRPDCLQETQQRPMEMIYPKEGAKIYIPLEANGSRGRMICTVAHRRSGTRIFWSLDDQYVGETLDFHQLALNPDPGKHKLTLVDAQGSRLQVSFEILDKTAN